MTNSIRWGLTTMTALALMVGGVAFYGCSSSSNPAPAPEDTGTGDDSATDSGADTTEQDTTPADTATDATDAADAPAATPDRKISLVHASPDLGAQFFCMGAASTDSTGKPTVVFQSLVLGIPNDPTGDPKQYKPFPYGAIASISVPNALLDKTTVAALSALTVVAFPVTTNPAIAATDAKNPCGAAFTAIAADATKYTYIPKNTLLAGTSTLISVTGCSNTANAAQPYCGGKAMSVQYKVLDLTAPTTDAGAPADTIAFHFFNASAFPTLTTPTTIPGWQNVDVWLMPMTASTTEADGGTTPGMAAGNPMMIASNVSYGDLVSPAQPFVLPAAADAKSTLMLLMPHGATPCVNPGGAPTATCTGWTLQLDKALAAFETYGGGFFKGTHQLLMLAGAPVPDPATGKATIGFGDVSKP